MTEEMMKKIELHCQWNTSGGRSGKRLILDEVDLHQEEAASLPTEQIYLSECNLSEMHFCEVSFYQAELYSCKFNGAVFTKCDFRKAVFDYCTFYGARFIDCSFPRMDSTESDFSGCTFEKCSFEGLSLMNCQIKNAHLCNVDMSDSYLGGVAVDGTEFTGLTNLDNAVRIEVSIFGNKLSEEAAIKLLTGEVS